MALPVRRVSGPTVEGGVEMFEQEGYTGHFGARPDGQVMCFGCRAEMPAGEVGLENLLRVEGESDPGDMAAVAAVRCPRCGEKGTLVLTYGPQAPVEDATVLRRLEDLRVPHDASALGPAGR